MWKGYAGFGGNEVINVARLVAYATRGAVPADTEVDPQVGPYEDLAAALGDGEYRTPLLDQPGWYDSTNPDSSDFAGLLPLDITGLDGSTKGRSVTESIRDGGTAGAVRGASRVMAVSAVALAASEAALDAGVSWLTGVLHPPCATGAEACSGSALDLFSAPPVYCSDLPDPDAAPVTTLLIPGDTEAEAPAWSYTDISGGDLLDPVCGPVTVSITVQLSEAGAADVDLTVDLVDSTGTVAGAVVLTLPDDGSPVTGEVTADPSPGYPLRWQVRLSWDDPGAVTLTELSYTRQPSLTADQCLAGLRRSYRNVVTVEGPTVVDQYPLRDGEAWAATVEWTWVATDPYPYGDATPLLGGVLVDHTTTSDHPAVTIASVGNVDLFIAPGSDMPPAGMDNPDTGMGPPPDWSAGQRWLLKDQTDAALNGIWIFNGDGAYLTRATDMDDWDSEVVGATVYVLLGVVNGDTTWATDASSGGTVDVTDMDWALDAGGGTPSPDNGYAFKAVGIQLGYNEDVTGVDTACPVPDPVTALCGDDPDLPPALLPPTVPTLPDPGMPVVDDYVRRAFQVPPELALVPGAVLQVMVRSLSDVAYRGIRVRLWADPDPDFGVDEECGFEQELYITYLPPRETVVIDGPNQQVTVTCPTTVPAGPETSDHERNMRGAYGGPFTFPELRCGARYHVTIDVPVTEDAGGVSVDVTAYRRGG